MIDDRTLGRLLSFLSASGRGVVTGRVCWWYGQDAQVQISCYRHINLSALKFLYIKTAKGLPRCLVQID